MLAATRRFPGPAVLEAVVWRVKKSFPKNLQNCSKTAKANASAPDCDTYGARTAAFRPGSDRAKDTKKVPLHEAGMSHVPSNMRRRRPRLTTEMLAANQANLLPFNDLAAALDEMRLKKTSTRVSWNVTWNQQHRSKTGARPKAGMSFRFNKNGATSICTKRVVFGKNVPGIDKNSTVDDGRGFPSLAGSANCVLH